MNRWAAVPQLRNQRSCNARIWIRIERGSKSAAGLSRATPRDHLVHQDRRNVTQPNVSGDRGARLDLGQVRLGYLRPRRQLVRADPGSLSERAEHAPWRPSRFAQLLALVHRLLPSPLFAVKARSAGREVVRSAKGPWNTGLSEAREDMPRKPLRAAAPTVRCRRLHGITGDATTADGASFEQGGACHRSAAELIRRNSIGIGGTMRRAVTTWRLGDAAAYDWALSVADRAVGASIDGSRSRQAALAIDGFDRPAVDTLTRTLSEVAMRSPDAASTPADVAHALEQRVIPQLFASVRPAAQPRFVIIGGQPGAGASRAIGSVSAGTGEDVVVISADVLAAFHPEVGDLESDARERVAAASAQWLVGCLRYARDNRLSLVLTGPFPDPTAIQGIIQGFREHGFQTAAVSVAASPAECQLAVVSLYAYSLHTRRDVRLHNTDAQAAFEHTRDVLRALETDHTVDELLIFNRVGHRVFDSLTIKPSSLRGGADAFEQSGSDPLTTLQATQWLSELRRVTRFTQGLHPAPAELTRGLVDLHQVALREIVPQLNAPSGSMVVRGLAERITVQLAELERAMPRLDRATPSPTGPLPPVGDRGGPSR